MSNLISTTATTQQDAATAGLSAHAPLQASRRWPALVLALGVALATAGAVGGPWISSVLAGGKDAALHDLELVIAGGKADARTWAAYGQALSSVRRFDHAAEAYSKAIDQEPFNRDARFGRALNLAMAGDREGLLGFLGQLVLSDAKLTVDIMQKKELAVFMGDMRFVALLQEAQSQSMD